MSRLGLKSPVPPKGGHDQKSTRIVAAGLLLVLMACADPSERATPTGSERATPTGEATRDDVELDCDGGTSEGVSITFVDGPPEDERVETAAAAMEAHVRRAFPDLPPSSFEGRFGGRTFFWRNDAGKIAIILSLGRDDDGHWRVEGWDGCTRTFQKHQPSYGKTTPTPPPDPG